ncbi:hypothetical protein M409DRAFT_66912 [Zasmidium cellare ATCC 36951]|uniref:Major facilitator superfamily (MFS) profile domain-containing protein n=1 Tax=Zasmidium cellare ATCC 36951 TaxID=1080233 RepID=A0A6A6CFT3_ZASCE|nr:uncharacterized protein M409DRAFT_66912 [Zasmidium cellare ATCC 36951]KAF2166005.1 hypothetical protein M409DRAFT_66912 [Zasmidium cellare ATCC 36951]
MDTSDRVQTADRKEPSINIDVENNKTADISSKAYDNETYSPEEAKRLRWKLDLRLIPILGFNIILAATDKACTSTGALYGMREDTHSTGNRYSWVGSAFYFGYLLWSLPAGSLLQKLPIAKFISVMFFGFGVVLIATAWVRSFPVFIFLRVLLGAMEAPIIPGGYLILSMWYTRHEQSLRTGFMYTNWSTIILIGPIGYAVGSIAGGHQWRWWFIILGSISIVWSCVIGLFLPDNVVRAKFIGEREKAIAVERVRGDQLGMENKTFKREQVVEALLDPKTWLMFFFNIFVSIPNGGLTNFQSLIIKGLGFSSRKAVLLGMPEGVVGTISTYSCSLAVCYLTKRWPNKQSRVAVIVIGELIGMIASIFLYTLPLTEVGGRLACLWLAKFFLGPYIISLSLNVANISGHTKKITVQALIFIAYCASNIIAPQFFIDSRAPLYPLGMGAILGAYVLAIITIILYAIYCFYENQRRDRIDSTRGERVHVDTDFKDLTDKENIHFRYVW